jgi:phage gp29-like protein
MKDEANNDALKQPGSYNNEVPQNNPLIGPPSILPGGDKVQIINQKLIIRPPYRQTADITSWRNANRAAEAMIPRRVWLYDLYDDIWLDAHLASVANKRIMGVTNAKWQFVDKEGKPVDEINNLIDSTAFEDILVSFVKSRLEGYSMLEIDYQNGKLSVYIIPKKHMRPETGIVAYEQTGDSGINIREGIFAQTVMEIGKTNDLGLFLSAAQYSIYKRGGMGDWANFVEVFGQPFIDAEWDGINEAQRVLLEQALENMGNGSKLVRPAGSKIELIESKANTSGGIQNTFIEALNKEISKVILGQTETTESSDSSGYAQSQTHAAVEDDINLSDINFTRRGLNTRFIEIMEALGIKTNGGKFVIVDEGAENISKKDKLEMDISLVSDIKLPIDDDYWYETYEIPKPDNYEQLKKEQQAAANAALVDLNSDPLKPQNAPTPVTTVTKPAKKAKVTKLKAPDTVTDEEMAGKMEKLREMYDHFFGSPRS